MVRIHVDFDPTDEAEVAEAARLMGLFGPAPKAKAADKPKPAKPAAKAKEPEPEPEEKEVTREDVRAALKKYMGQYSKEAAIKILQDHGAASVGKLDEDRFGDVMEACESPPAEEEGDALDD